MNRKIKISDLNVKEGWAKATAEKVIELNDADIYTTAAGISPSGIVHFGNFRDVITSYSVLKEIKKQKPARMLFSWDDFDRFRKVPAGVDKSFEQYIGLPLSKVPDPHGNLKSYAERFKQPFIESLKKLDIDIEYIHQTDMYESGAYDEQIKFCLQNREKIADILLSFMTDKAKGEKGINPKEYKENYYPLSVYSKFTGKDNTKVLSYDGDTKITYMCFDTKQEDTIDFTKDRIVKLSWKVDWPMRWKFEKVHFEPGGHDHASSGGSYDVGSTISKELFKYEAPIFIEYKFVGIQGLGSKMSSSAGNAISLEDLLEIYEPDLLMWIYERKSPNQSFELAFNSDIYRQYEEYDKENENNAITFRQAVSFGQIIQWDKDKLDSILKELDLNYTKESIETRIPLAKNYLEKYNRDELISIRKDINSEYEKELTDNEKKQILDLRDYLKENQSASIADLEFYVYEIPKKDSKGDLKKEQRNFFKHVYNLLISRDAGPRLGTFLWAIDKNKAIELLSI